MNGKSRKVFTPVQLYICCLAEVQAQSANKDKADLDWIDHINEDDIMENLDKLSDSGRKEFERQLKKAANKLGGEFECLDLYKDSMNERQYAISVLRAKISDELYNFLDKT